VIEVIFFMRAISFGHVLAERLLARSAQHELVLVRRHRGVEGEVLLGLQIQLDARYVRHFVLQAPGDFGSARGAIVIAPSD
jgi:hypothetical protein